MLYKIYKEQKKTVALLLKIYDKNQGDSLQHEKDTMEG